MATQRRRLPRYGATSESEAASPRRNSRGGDPSGQRLLLLFHANDIGRAAFDREPLALTPRGLVLNRYETEIRFMRVSH